MQKNRAYLTIKKKTVLIVLILLIVIMPFQVSSSLLTSSTSLASSGSIIYPYAESVPLVDPENSSSYDLPDIINVSSVLPYTGWGADLTVHYSDQEMDEGQWDNLFPKLEYWANRGMNVMRIEFSFEDTWLGVGSTYYKYKFDWLLEHLHEIGIKPIADLHNAGGGSTKDSSIEIANYVQNPLFYSNWLQFARDYKDDERLAAIQIFNEPTNLDVKGLSNTQQVQLFADLVYEIHEIDPDRVVIFPYWALMWGYNSIYDWFADLDASGITTEPYVVYDISHPYYWENEWDRGLSPEERAISFATTQLEPAITKFGSSNCWVGETFAHYQTTGFGPATEELQSRFVLQMINECVRLGVGFDLLACTSGSARWNIHVAILESSDYQVNS